MRHFILTRASYGPEWSVEANRRRLRITEAVTARLLAQQRGGFRWSWIVLLDGRDPLLTERVRVFGDAAPELLPVIWEPDEVSGAPWDKHAEQNDRSQAVAATAYRHPGWLQYTPRDRPILQTRLDDDDGLAIDYLRRVQRAAEGLSERTALMLPRGVRVWDGRQTWVRHDTNAMHTLFTPAGDETTVYSYGHRLVARHQPVKIVDERPAWIWVRHPDTISGWKRADRKIQPETRRLFPVDWRVIAP